VRDDRFGHQSSQVNDGIKGEREKVVEEYRINAELEEADKLRPTANAAAQKEADVGENKLLLTVCDLLVKVMRRLPNSLDIEAEIVDMTMECLFVILDGT
jgi:hypothetical protein